MNFNFQVSGLRSQDSSFIFPCQSGSDFQLSAFQVSVFYLQFHPRCSALNVECRMFPPRPPISPGEPQPAPNLGAVIGHVFPGCQAGHPSNYFFTIFVRALSCQGGLMDCKPEKDSIAAERWSFERNASAPARVLWHCPNPGSAATAAADPPPVLRAAGGISLCAAHPS